MADDPRLMKGDRFGGGERGGGGMPPAATNSLDALGGLAEGGGDPMPSGPQAALLAAHPPTMGPHVDPGAHGMTPQAALAGPMMDVGGGAAPGGGGGFSIPPDVLAARMGGGGGERGGGGDSLAPLDNIRAAGGSMSADQNPNGFPRAPMKQADPQAMVTGGAGEAKPGITPAPGGGAQEDLAGGGGPDVQAPDQRRGRRRMMQGGDGMGGAPALAGLASLVNGFGQGGY